MFSATAEMANCSSLTSSLTNIRSAVTVSSIILRARSSTSRMPLLAAIDLAAVRSTSYSS